MRIKYKNYVKKGELIDGVTTSKHELRAVFRNMHNRCVNKVDPGFINYGARGISVCDRWNSFVNFVADMGPRPSPEYTIERVDNSKGYSPDNCVWATRSDQCVNRRMFKNNTTGVVGVIMAGASWVARFDYEHVRYSIGWFKTQEEAVAAREKFINLFFVNRDAAIATLPKDKARHTSKTGVRGVTPHYDKRGYIVRVTISGKRHYVGYFLSFEEAVDAKHQYLKATG